MKPIRLKLQAFGSFPGAQEVDFEALAPRGLFVVGGDTGTGKTTLFDAMCWALYGEMPLKESGGVRSDHADAGTDTYVEFTFECDGRRYVVRRTPEHLRPAKRGTGMVRDAAAARLDLVSHSESRSLTTKANETSEVCSELVGLDAGQFQRVVLLPQGEFARFLLAGSREREELLGKLFGGQVFDDMVEYLKSCRSELGSEVSAAEADISARLESSRVHLVHAHAALGIDAPASLPDVGPTGSGQGTGDQDAVDEGGVDEGGVEEDGVDEDGVEVAPADRELVGRLRDGLSEPLRELRETVERVKLEAEVATRVHNDAEAGADRFDRTLEHLERLEGLEAEADQVAAGEALAEASRAARPVTDEVAKHGLDLENLVEAKRVRDLRVAAITEAFTGLGLAVDPSSASAVTQALADQLVRHKDDNALLEAEEKAAAALRAAENACNKAGTDLEAKRGEHRDASARAVRIEEVELPDLHSGFVDPEVVKENLGATTASIEGHTGLDGLRESLEVARRAQLSAIDDYDRTFDAFVATEAPRLAATLTEGEPCPVCGSVAHPTPAENDGGPSASYEDLQAAADARQQATGPVDDLVARVAGASAALGDDAEVSVDELKARQARLSEEFATATGTAKRIEELRTELDRVRGQVVELDKAIAGLVVARDNAGVQLDSAGSLHLEARQAANGIDPGEVAERADLLKQLEEQTTGLDALFTAVATADTSWKDSGDRVSRVLEQSRFDNVEQAAAAALAPEAEEQLLTAAQEHKKARSTTEDRLRVLNEQGVPGERPDLGATAEAVACAGAVYARSSSAHTTATDACTYCDDALAEHDTILSDTASVRARFEQADRAYVVCHDGGALDMSLKRWVLTRELDDVTRAANVHLAHMTAHRYSLRRRSEVTDRRKSSGLDLEVLDATTGRARSTTSLSGGEQFQASLSLALGLADVVSRGGSASGKRFEALFVDEGFGSLDPRSLEDAIEALHQLRATGRMVGAITHVEAMKQQLHVGIEVTRLRDGAGSTLTVHP